MSGLDFGRQLRAFRLQCGDPVAGKQLSQQKLGELMQNEMGIRYSGAAVSDWERGESVIGVNDRPVLIGLIKILNRHGGIKTLSDANALLEAGNYRSLNADERKALFPGMGAQDVSPSPPGNPGKAPQTTGFLLNNFLFISPEEFREAINKAGEGPPPAWPRVLVSIIRKMTDRISAAHVLRALLWLWVWIITYLLVAPSLQWLPAAGNEALRAAVLYAAGSIVLPPIIGALTDTSGNLFWKEQAIPNRLMLRLYVHQGAYVGFHVGYFMIFPLTLMQNLPHLQPAGWVEAVKVTVPIVVGYAGAQLIPYNLWLAFGRLDFRDGGVFFFFALLGPLWAWFFFEFHEFFVSPVTGMVMILTAVTILAVTTAVKTGRR